MRKELYVVLTAILAWLGLACVANAQQDSGELTQLKMGTPSLAFHELPLIVAAERGFFQDEGLDVDIIFMSSGSEAATALMSGSIDVLGAAVAHAVSLRAKGAEVKLIAGVAELRDWAVVVAAKDHGDVTEISDLKGLRIAAPRRGSDGDQVLRHLLEEAGLDTSSDVQIIQIAGFENAVNAMENGDVDAAMLLEPFLTTSKNSGTSKPVIDLMTDSPPAFADRAWTGIVVSDAFLNEHADTSEALVRAVKRAIDSIYAEPEANYPVLKKYFPNISDDDLQAIYARLLGTTNGKRAFAIAIGPDVIAAENAFLENLDQISAPVPYEDVVAVQMKEDW